MHATAAVVQQQKQGSKTPPGGRSGEFFFGGHGWRAMWSRKPTSVNTGLQSGAMVKRYQARRRRHGIPTMSLCGESSGAAAVPHVCVTAILYTEIECGRHVWRLEQQHTHPKSHSIYLFRSPMYLLKLLPALTVRSCLGRSHHLRARPSLGSCSSAAGGW